MKLSPEDIEAVALAVVAKIDINAIAREVVAEMKRVESITLDAQYMASLSFEEQKRLGHQKLMDSRKKRNKR